MLLSSLYVLIDSRNRQERALNNAILSANYTRRSSNNKTRRYIKIKDMYGL